MSNFLFVQLSFFLLCRCIHLLKEDGSSNSSSNSNSCVDGGNQKKSDVDHDGSALGFTVKNLNSFAMALLADLWSNGHNSSSNSGTTNSSQPSVAGSEREAKKMKAKILYKKLMVIDNIRLKAWKWKLEKLEFL